MLALLLKTHRSDPRRTWFRRGSGSGQCYKTVVLRSTFLIFITYCLAQASSLRLIKKIHATYADQLGSAPQGKTFPELYDVQKVQPTSGYLGVSKRAKDQLAKLGVPHTQQRRFSDEFKPDGLGLLQ